MEEKKKSPIKIAGEAVLSIALIVLSFFLQYGLPWNYEWLWILIMFGTAICFFAGYVIGEELLPRRKTPFEKRLFVITILSAGILMQAIALVMVYLLPYDKSVYRVILTYIETLAVFDTLVNWQDPKSKKTANWICRIGILAMVAIGAYLLMTDGLVMRCVMVCTLLLLQCIVLIFFAF